MINSINGTIQPKNNPFGNVSKRNSVADYWLENNSQPNNNISNTLSAILPETIILNPEEARKTNNLKIIGVSIASATVLVAAGIFFVLRGGPKGVAKGFQSLRNFLERKVQKSKLYGVRASGYEYLLGKADYLLNKAQAINNFTTIKDFTFKKLMYGGNWNWKYTRKIHNGITDIFEKLGLKTVAKSYKNSISKFNNLSERNLSIIAELEKNTDLSETVHMYGGTITKKELVEFLKRRNKETDKLIKENFSEDTRKARYLNIQKITKELEQSFEEKGTFWFLSKDTLKDFVAEAEILPKKLEIQKQILDSKKSISYSPRALYNDADEIIMKISSTLKVTDNDALKSLNKVREDFKSFSKTGKIDIHKMTEDLAVMEYQISNKSSAMLNDNVLKMVQNLKSLYMDYKQGKIEDILEVYKVLLPKEQYVKIEKEFKGAIKSLNKSIKLETEDFINKSRDLTMGSAPTDILTVLGGFGTLAYYLGKSDNQQERTAITLKYGIPALVGIGVSLYGNARLFAGSKSLMFATISSFLANRIGTFANNLYEKHLKNTGKFIEPSDKSSQNA